MNKNNIVFELGAEGGSFIIYQLMIHEKKIFSINQSEISMDEDVKGSSSDTNFDTFDHAFSAVIEKYDWHYLYPIQVAKEFQKVVRAKLVNKLNADKMHEKDFFNCIDQWQKALNIQLRYNHIAKETTMYDIELKVQNGTTTEYDYSNFSGDYFSDGVHHDDVKMFKKTILPNWQNHFCTGTITFANGMVILWDANNNTQQYFNSTEVQISVGSPVVQSQFWTYL